MKKNVIANLTSPKGNKKSLFQRFHILPRILCLLLALLIWLTVVNLLDREDEELPAGSEPALETTV